MFKHSSTTFLEFFMNRNMKRVFSFAARCQIFLIFTWTLQKKKPGTTSPVDAFAWTDRLSVLNHGRLPYGHRQAPAAAHILWPVSNKRPFWLMKSKGRTRDWPFVRAHVRPDLGVAGNMLRQRETSCQLQPSRQKKELDSGQWAFCRYFCRDQ